MDKDKKIKQLEAEIEKLKALAYKDELTNLYNRRGFKEESGKFLKEVSAFKSNPERRQSVIIKSFSIIIFDIDYFKKFNDNYGHQAGDAVLEFLAKILEEQVREIDLVSRWGGEEMVVGLVGAGEEDASHIAELVRERLEREGFKWRGKKLNLTISAGVASLDSVKDFDSLFKNADKALYFAKENGRNRVVAYSDIK